MTASRKRTERICQGCNESFRPWTTLQRFCSRTCQGKAQRKAPNATCKRCGSAFARPPSGDRRYCSQRCGWDARVDRAWATVRCLNCNAEFGRRSQPSWSKAKRVFCSTLCSQNYTAGENHPRWRGGHEPYFGRAWGRLAESIRERDGRRCRRCGRTEKEEGRRLSVDHVIPRRAFDDIEKANDPANLVALCNSCHGRKGRAEAKWLKGDVLDMWAYQIAVAQPWPSSDPLQLEETGS